MPVPNKQSASTLVVIVAFATVYIVWGSTYFFIQKAMGSFPPMLLGATRFIIAGLIMLGWSLWRGEQVLVKKDIGHVAVSGLLMLFIGTGAVIWVEQYLPSAMVAIMVSSSPLWFILMDKPKWKENFKSKITIGGLIFGFAGVMVLFSEKIVAAFSTADNSAELGAIGILIIGSMAWSGGSLYSKYNSTSVSISVNAAWQMLAAGVAFVIPALIRGEFQQIEWSSVSTGAWLSVGYLVVFGSIAAFSAYVWLLNVRPATQVSTYAYVNPVVAVLLGVFFANENISFIQILGLVIILGSVLLISLVKYRKEQQAVAAKKETEEALNIQQRGKVYQPVTIKPVENIEE